MTRQPEIPVKAPAFIAGTETMHAGVVLQAIKASLDKAFARHLDPILNIAGMVPACSGNILEWHFQNEAAPFDFACRINALHDKPLLALPQQPGGTPRSISTGYQRLVDRSNACFNFGIENVWFEYDAPFRQPPALFFDLDSNGTMPVIKKWMALQTITGYFNCTLHPALPGFVEKIYTSRLSMVYVGLMFSRRSAAVRLTLHGIEPHCLMEALLLLGWSGNHAIVSGLQTRFLHAGQKLVLAVDVGDRLMPRIGIEVFDDDTATFTWRLYQNNLLTQCQRSLLLQWPGKNTLAPAVSQALTHLHRRSIQYVYKRINHFKFIVDGDAVAAKAYLYYCF